MKKFLKDWWFIICASTAIIFLIINVYSSMIEENELKKEKLILEIRLLKTQLNEPN
jgi:type II secretory pathway component PulF